MNRLIKNNEGSTLLMIIIMIAVLTVLGTALISMSMMNVNMKYNDYRAKRSTYFAEAGIDEAYALVGGLVDEALVIATSETATRLDAIKNNKSSSIYLADGSLDDEELQLTSNAIFIEEFKTAFNVNAEPDLVTSITAINTEIDSRIASNGLTYDITLSIDDTADAYGIAGIDNFSEGNPDTFVLKNLTATYTYEDFTEKSVSTDIVVSVPQFHFPVKAVENIITVDTNPLWQHALVSSENNIIFSTGSSTINGDIYAEGYKPPDLTNALAFGGIKVSSNTIATIKGDVVSDSYVQVYGSNSTLNIDDSHVYCDSLTMQSTASDSLINIDNSNVYTRDDIELNGPRSTISIDGSYFGFSTGGGGGHAQSSCVLINSELDTIGTTDGAVGSKIEITGNPVGINYAEAVDSGIYISGTAYVNTSGADYNGNSNTWPYQTGESLSVKRNYYAYSYSLTGSGTYVNDYEKIEYVDGGGLNFAVGYNDGSKSLLQPNQKVEFFMKFYNDVYTTGVADNYLRFGTQDSIKIGIGSYKNTLGAVIGYNGSTPMVTKVGDGTYENDRKQIEADYNYYIMRGANNTEFETDNSLDVNNPDIYTHYTNPAGPVGVTNYEREEDSVLHSGKATEVVYVSSAPEGNDKYTIGYGSTNDLNLNDNNGQVQGIIIYDGDVVIDVSVANPDLEFVGVIIASGNITIQGNGSKYFYSFDDDHSNISDVERFMIKTIGGTAGLENYFDSPNLPSTTPLRIVDEVTIAASSESNKNQNRYNELIYYDNWRIE